MLTLVEEVQIRFEPLVVVERVRLELVDQQILKRQRLIELDFDLDRSNLDHSI